MAAQTTILCYGDSLTWGSDPVSGLRHPPQSRWPEVLAAGLKGRATVIADGLRGRTTAYDEHLADCDRNGARTLPTALYNHAPLDLVILMLGSNDMKPHIAGKAVAALQGMRRLVSIVNHHNPGPDMNRPKCLIVSPPPICETDEPFFAEMLAGGVEQSALLAGQYRALANETGCGFFDAGTVCRASSLDGIHLDAAETIKLGEALVPVVEWLLD